MSQILSRGSRGNIRDMKLSMICVDVLIKEMSIEETVALIGIGSMSQNTRWASC